MPSEPVRSVLLTYWRLSGYEKARSYYLRENLGYVWRRYRDRGRMTGAAAARLADLEGQPFIYYPLHTEPETALQTLSPEYFYQLSSIAALSRDLPSRERLARKRPVAAARDRRGAREAVAPGPAAVSGSPR